MYARLNACLQYVVILLLLLVAGCSGHASGFLAADDPAPAIYGPVQDQAAVQFPSLPALPAGALDSPGRFTASEKDNYQFGYEDWSHGSPGVDFSDKNLILYGPTGEYGAWAIWQWSGFTGG